MRAPCIYVGCSLTHASQEWRDRIEEVKNELGKHYHVLSFLGLCRTEPGAVYRWDIQRCVGCAELLVAFCDHASLGLGVEIGAAALYYGVPTLALAHTDSHVSQMIPDMAHEEQGVCFERYTDHDDALRVIHYYAAKAPHRNEADAVLAEYA